MEDVIRFAEDTMATITLPADTQAELVEQLDVLRVSCDIFAVVYVGGREKFVTHF